MENKFTFKSVREILRKKKLLLGLGVVLASGVIGSVYYLFNIFRNGVELTEDQKMQIEEIKEEIEESNCELSVDTAIQIVSLITRIAEESFNSNSKMNFLCNKRRNELKITNSSNDYSNYYQLCKETFKFKEKCLSEATRKVLYQLGNLSYEKIQKVLKKISTYEMESITYKFNHPNFEENSFPDKSIVKEAFIYYANKSISEMKQFQRENTQIVNSPSYFKLIEPNLIFKLLVIKIKVDDELFNKFQYTEDQIRYLLYEYNLLEDGEVRKLYDDLNLSNIYEN